MPYPIVKNLPKRIPSGLHTYKTVADFRALIKAAFFY